MITQLIEQRLKEEADKQASKEAHGLSLVIEAELEKLGVSKFTTPIWDLIASVREQRANNLMLAKANAIADQIMAAKYEPEGAYAELAKVTAECTKIRKLLDAVVKA